MVEKTNALLVLLITCALVMMGASAATADDSVNVCGTLTSLTQPTATNNVGSATVDGKIYYLSGTPGPNETSPQATAGSKVCLTGQIAATQTGPTPLLIRWSITPAPVATAPAPTSTLPSTNTVPRDGFPSGPLLIGFAGLAVIAGLALFARRGIRA